MTDVAPYPVDVLPNDPAEQAAQIADVIPEGAIQFTWRGRTFTVQPMLSWPARTLRMMDDPTKNAMGLISAVFGEEAYSEVENAPGATVGDILDLVTALEVALGTKPGEAAASAVS